MSVYSDKIREIIEEVSKAVVGKEEILKKVLTAILAKGHILIEDVPGVGKTTLALAFSKVMELEYRRVQFTPDVLPTDVVGFSMLNQENELEYKSGAVLCNLFLADEINRTSSKTQSALLEVMEEGNVTVDGYTIEVPKPFVVIATQNPIGSIGTQMLPESQLDRFMIKISMGYPQVSQEIEMLKGRQAVQPLDTLRSVITLEELTKLQAAVEQIYVHDEVYGYLLQLITATRKHPLIELGISPRGSIALTDMAKAQALMEGRDYVIPEDVKQVFSDVATHRILLNQKGKINHMTSESILKEVLEKIALPRIK